MAFILIVGGCTGIILLSKSQVTVLTSDDVLDQLTSVSTIIFSALYIIFVVCNYLLNRWFVGQLRLFEQQGVRWARFFLSRSAQSQSSFTLSTAMTPRKGKSAEPGTASRSPNFLATDDDNFFTFRSSTASTVSGQYTSLRSGLEVEIAGPRQERPLSTLIVTIQNTRVEQMSEVAPGVSKQLKRFIKVPMVS